MPSENNLYVILGLTSDASLEEIRRAYYEAARRIHPDVNRAPGANELFLRVQEAYEILSSPERRTSYDAEVAAQEEQNPPPVLQNILYSRSALPPLDEPQLLYVMLELYANPRLALQPPPPINASLILDRSTSMHGERMDTVKSAAIEIIRALRPEDTLSVIAFGDRAEVLVPASLRHERNPDLETQVRMLRAGGATEIFQGLQAGFSEVRHHLSKKVINHLILITDGRTYGDEAACLTLAMKAASAGVRITALGIGEEWNDVFLDNLASHTGGSCFYVSKANDIKDLLENIFSNLNKVSAEQVTLNLELSPEVELRYAFRVQPDARPLEPTLPLRLGSVPREGRLSVLLEFCVPPLTSQNQKFVLAAGEFHLEFPAHPEAVEHLPVRLRSSVSPAPAPEEPPDSIFQALTQITLYRMQEKARTELAAGNATGARRHLEYLATHLLAHGQHELARTVLMEVEQVEKTQSLSGSGEKRIKFGTRALLLPAPTPGNAL